MLCAYHNMEMNLLSRNNKPNRIDRSLQNRNELHHLTSNELERLRPGGWLNDTIIDASMDSLRARL